MKAIIWYEGITDPEPCDNIFPNRFLGIHILHICQKFSFNQLGEVVRADQQISFFPAALGKRPTMSKPHWANGQGLDRGLRTPPGQWILGANLWHQSHFFIYSCASFCILATNSLEWWLCETKIFLLYGFHKSLNVTPQGVALTPQGECRVGTTQKMSACTVFVLG